MKVVILCGGKGTRIRGLSEELPKPLIPIGSAPIVEHIMRIYSHYGYNGFVLCLGYKGWKFKEYFLNYRCEAVDFTVDLADPGSLEFFDTNPIPPWRVTLSDTGLESMTGARIKRVQKYIGDNRFMLTYGDGVGNVNIARLVDFHKSHGKLVTVTSVRPPSRFGEIVVQNGAVVDFQEKPQTTAGWINGGFFVCEPGVFDFVSDDSNCVWEKEPLQKIARDGQLMTYVHEGFWMPMDTAREYQLLNDLWSRGKAPWSPGAVGTGL
jgi:glucose-1-phosphate cytidylyltransferase